MQLKRIMKNILRNTVDYYSKEDRRAFDRDGICQYLSSGGKRCAVGRLMTEREAVKMHPGCVTEANTVIGVPDRIRFLTLGFLSDLQHLHDENLFWKDSGLSYAGVEKVKRISVDIAAGYESNEWDFDGD